MTGPKTNERPGTRASVQHVRASAYKAREVLNEKSYTAGERSGTKAQAKYVRTSASKVRVVLDLIRGVDVKSADQVLQLTERHTAIPVRKVLASAVANAVNNDDQDADELYVVACFADEGPTLRRFKPRARGRATRINKRTCHITLIVSRMDDDKLDVRRNREERRAAGASAPKADRSARVAKSKAATEPTETSADEEVVQDAASDAAGEEE
jgi:large subunit ribosomal protein L22